MAPLARVGRVMKRVGRIGAWVETGEDDADT